MKTFLNVLYRRILYKIPLKFLLILIAILGLFFASANAELVLKEQYDMSVSDVSYVYNTGDFSCFILNSCDYYGSTSFNFGMETYNNGNSAMNLNFIGGTIPLNANKGMGYCFDDVLWIVPNNNTCNITISVYEIEEYSSMQCQMEYNLMPIENVDSNYCELNGLCTICGEGSGEINTGVNWSSLFINGEQINSNAIIDITTENRMGIDLEYLNDTIDIDVTTNVDTKYIEDVIKKENLTPTNEDVEYYIQGLSAFIPYLALAILFLFTIKLINRVRK